VTLRQAIRDGLATARARGRTGERLPKLTQDQVQLAQRLYDAGEHTVARIASLLRVRRTTLYGRSKKRPSAPSTPPPRCPPGASTKIPTTPAGGEPSSISSVRPRTSRACSSCGHEPATRAEVIHQRADLAVTWLYPDPDQPSQLVVPQHCRQCQPDQVVVDIACTVCGDDPILTGALAAAVTDPNDQPVPVQRWLTAAGWLTTPTLQCPTTSTNRLPSHCWAVSPLDAVSGQAQSVKCKADGKRIRLVPSPATAGEFRGFQISDGAIRA